MTEQYNTSKDNMRKLLPCILILLIVAVVTGQRRVSNQRDCSKNEYWSDGLCCDRCAPGYKLIKKCSSGIQSECEKCSNGTYQDNMNYFPNCFRCQKCSKRHSVIISPCTNQNNSLWMSAWIPHEVLRRVLTFINQDFMGLRVLEKASNPDIVRILLLKYTGLPPLGPCLA